jgi:alpha-amylase/alpha-mannosidase (GH57 family)
VADGNCLPVLFLWHHHQPFYASPEGELPLLPWVRLHAVRGYQDMAMSARQHDAHVTFNFSPSLLEQLELAAKRTPCDEFERISRIPAHDLNADEKRFILKNFFSINWSVHVKPNARYFALLQKRGERQSDQTISRGLTDFSAEDYQDLIALFNLSWVGYSGRKNPRVADLVAKGKNYSYSECEALLDYHHEVLKALLPTYQDLFQAQIIDLSTSPYSHSILPLLCDTYIAAADISRQHLPRPSYSHSNDAQVQLELAQTVFKKTWGKKPQGLWPSEGTVSDATMELVAARGFQWLATDQRILERSDGVQSEIGDHFSAYYWRSGGTDLRIYFRDYGLSDAIGFRYATMDGENAAAEFIEHLEQIESNTRNHRGRCVVIALDGENPWESYLDGGESFITQIYQRINDHPRLTLSRFAGHLNEPANNCLTSIHPGSWIDSNFKIWIGDPEKNQAWIELERAHKCFDDLDNGDERKLAAQKWLLRAQCSDWFWWYGEPFSSDYKPQFDELFRKYVAGIYEALGKNVPPSLQVPLIAPAKMERRLQPVFPITPTLEGRVTSFYEWAGACHIEMRQFATVMGRAEHFLRAIYYGFDALQVYFRFDPMATLYPKQNRVLTFYIVGDSQISKSVSMNEPFCGLLEDGIQCSYNQIIEVSVELARIGLQPGAECQFWAEIFEAGKCLEKFPPEGVFRFLIPTEETIQYNWLV